MTKNRWAELQAHFNEEQGKHGLVYWHAGISYANLGLTPPVIQYLPPGASLEVRGPFSGEISAAEMTKRLVDDGVYPFTSPFQMLDALRQMARIPADGLRGLVREKHAFVFMGLYFFTEDGPRQAILHQRAPDPAAGVMHGGPAIGCFDESMKWKDKNFLSRQAEKTGDINMMQVLHAVGWKPA